MDGLLLRLLDDTRASSGQSFWPCFEPLRSTFDRHFWIFQSQPWMSPPATFDDERECADYEGVGETSVALWRPGAIGRWADRFGEEHVELWATNPAADPTLLASKFRRTLYSPDDAFIEKHAGIWLIYSDGTCWEFFAREPRLIHLVRDHLSGSASVRAYDAASTNRRGAYVKAGIGEVWRAMYE